jgi:hypothetical protein
LRALLGFVRGSWPQLADLAGLAAVMRQIIVIIQQFRTMRRVNTARIF